MFNGLFRELVHRRLPLGDGPSDVQVADVRYWKGGFWFYGEFSSRLKQFLKTLSFRILSIDQRKSDDGVLTKSARRLLLSKFFSQSASDEPFAHRFKPCTFVTHNLQPFDANWRRS